MSNKTTTSFEEWWKENEGVLSAVHYDGHNWTEVYQLVQKAYKAGRQSVIDAVEHAINADSECEVWDHELLTAKEVLREIL